MGRPPFWLIGEAGRYATIDHDFRTGDVAGGVAGQEGDQRPDISWLADAIQRMLIFDSLLLGFCVICRFKEVYSRLRTQPGQTAMTRI